MDKAIYSIIEKLENQIISDRRYIHQNPEVSFEEYNTMEYICKRLDSLGIKYEKNIAGTGVLAQIDSGKEGKCLLIRADIDALPVTEKNELEFKSVNDGVMHACGHDAHTAILLNTCEVLNQLKYSWCGTLKFAFQPAEETTGGAKPMIEYGILDNPKVDACIALHVDSDLTVGTIRVKEGPLYASPDNFEITINGRGAHGAEPHLAIDPIVISAQIINQLQTIVSRGIDPFGQAVVTVGSIHSGDTYNVIPDSAKLLGTARSYDAETRDMLENKIGEIAKNICASYGAECIYNFIRLYPPLINDSEIADKLYECAKDFLGDENCIKGGNPSMAGEDFAYFSQLVPSALFKLGCRNDDKGINAPLHNPYFNIDEDCLKYGVGVFVDFALNFLA